MICQAFVNISYAVLIPQVPGSQEEHYDVHVASNRFAADGCHRSEDDLEPGGGVKL